jgi:hypothetical protein
MWTRFGNRTHLLLPVQRRNGSCTAGPVRKRPSTTSCVSSMPTWNNGLCSILVSPWIKDRPLIENQFVVNKSSSCYFLLFRATGLRRQDTSTSTRTSAQTSTEEHRALPQLLPDTCHPSRSRHAEDGEHDRLLKWCLEIERESMDWIQFARGHSLREGLLWTQKWTFVFYKRRRVSDHLSNCQYNYAPCRYLCMDLIQKACESVNSIV